MTREELIQALRHCGGLGMKICDGDELNHADKCAGCPNEAKMASESARECFRAWIEAADMLEKDAQKWISVEDRLPENFVDVLVWFEYFRYGDYNCLYRTTGVSYTYNGEWLTVNGKSGWSELKILAWMPLPEPQKED